MDINKVLEKYGFSSKEVDVYLAILELGPSIVSSIAKKAGIKRSTTYVVLDSLIEKEVLSVTDRNGIKTYSPIDPDALVNQLEEKAVEFTEMAKVAKKLLPEIVKKQKEREPESNIRLYEGEDGMKSVYEDALASLETIRAYSASGESLEGKPLFTSRKKHKIKTISLDTSEAREMMASPQESYGFLPNISIYDGKVVFMSPGDNKAVVIENIELAEALKKAFDLSWKNAKKFEGKTRLANGMA